MAHSRRQEAQSSPRAHCRTWSTRIPERPNRPALREAKLEWTYPNNVSLGSYTQPTAKRAQVEIAPTAWSEVSQINLNDKKLHWYHYDESRNDTLIPIEELAEANE